MSVAPMRLVIASLLPLQAAGGGPPLPKVPSPRREYADAAVPTQGEPCAAAMRAPCGLEAAAAFAYPDVVTAGGDQPCHRTAVTISA